MGKGPRHNYDRKRYSQGAGLTGELNGSVRQREEEITNWRDATDIQSFYFTRFPEEMGEKDMWLKFKKWRDLREVFIARHRNRNGRRYDFVCFKGVEDVKLLERQLDNMVIGGLKLHANLLKHGRERTTDKKANSEVQSKVGMNRSRACVDGQEHNRNDAVLNIGDVRMFNQHTHQWTKPRSYANVLATGIRNVGKREIQGQKYQTLTTSHSSLQLNIPMEQVKRFSNTWVGRLRKLSAFDKLEDEFMWEAGPEVKPKYLGDDMVLLVGLNDTRAEELCNAEEDKGISLFHSLEKWNPGLRTGYRLVWILCWGVPLHAWDINNISKIAAVVGEVDDDAEELRKLDRARVLIKTPRRS